VIITLCKKTNNILFSLCKQGIEINKVSMYKVFNSYKEFLVMEVCGNVENIVFVLVGI
jgi:hypothetical protein